MLNTKPLKYIFLILFLSVISGCVPLEQQGQTNESGAAQQLLYQDHVYVPSIKTVQLYVATGMADEVLEPPILPIRQEQPLVLEFDKIRAAPQRLVVKIIHCNANWMPSGLNDTQVLYDFNEFFLTDNRPSVNTRVPYVHYRFVVPRVKLSGNYLLLVQEEGGNYLLTQRFMVYQNLAVVTAKLGVPSGPTGRFSRQPVEFNVFYQDYQLVNPALEVKAVLRQNYRWDNARYISKPTFVREDLKRLEYVFFEPEASFLGLSEFRPFDTRSIRFNGIGVSEINIQASPVEVYLQTDRSREGLAFSQDPDINGMFIIGNKEYGRGDVNADYTWVNFELKSPQEYNGAVHITGGLADWQHTSDTRMTYSPERKAYTGRMFLKQGFYNYYYTYLPRIGAEPDPSFFEGSHFATENNYDILIYYRPPGTRADLLIGYEEVFFNRR